MKTDNPWFGWKTILTSAALVFTLVPAVALGAPLPAGTCENVDGTIEGVAIPVFENGQLAGFEVFGTSSTGPLAGDFSASLTVEKVTRGGTMHISGSHTFANTAFGTFTTSDKITVTPDGRVHSRLTIVDGTKGVIQDHGNVDLATGALSVWYHGRVCQA